MSFSEVEVTTDASGAAEAAARGRVVVIVDIIDFSTTMEAALEAGALEVWGASPRGSNAPVSLSPREIGYLAGYRARQLGVPLVIIAEPRVGKDTERRQRALPALLGVQETKAEIKALVPNLGVETVKLVEFDNTVVLGISDSGGTAFDAAFTARGTVCTATIARVNGIKGLTIADRGIKRASLLAKKLGVGVSMVAASGNSLEDMLAAQYLAMLYTNRHKLVP